MHISTQALFSLGGLSLSFTPQAQLLIQASLEELDSKM